MNSDPLAQYERDHAIPAGKLAEAGWRYEYTKDSHGKERPAIMFPTTGGKRWRFVDGEKPKYHHSSGYKHCWYGLERTIRNLAKYHIVDCNGAASTIAGFYAGIPAYSYQSGESSAPDADALAIFEKLVDKKLLILVAFDCDLEGRRSAEKRVRWYRLHGYKAEAIDLGLDIKGGDLADFVKLHPVDTVPAFDALDLILVENEVPEPPKLSKPTDFTPDSERDFELAMLALDALAGWRCDTYSDWINVGMALQSLGERGLFLWDQWSSGSDKYKANECQRRWRSFKKGGLTLGSLFKWADEDMPTWRPYKPEKGRTARTVQAEPATHYAKVDVEWRDGVPTSVRAAAVSLLPASVAPVFELWFEGSMRGDLDWETPVPTDYLLCLSNTYQRGISKRQIERGLSQGKGILWDVYPDSVDFATSTVHSDHIESTESFLEDLKIGKLVAKSTQRQIYTPCKKLIGRKAIHYQLLPRRTILANLAKLAIVPILEKWFPVELGIVPPIRAEFLKQLGVDDSEASRLEKELDEKYGDQIASQRGFAATLRRAKTEYKRYERALANTHSARIPDGLTYANKSEYLRACARAILTQEGGSTQWAQKAWAAVLGCSPRSLDGIFKAADIRQEKDQHCDVEIKTIEQLEQTDKRFSETCNGYPSEVISSRTKDVFPFEPGQPLSLWAGSQLSSGAKLTLRYQQAHKQFLEELSKPKPLTYWRALCQKAVIAFLIEHPLPLKESKPRKKKAPAKRKPTYAEKVIEVMVDKFTPLGCNDGQMIDPLTGEYVDANVQAMIDGLLNAPEPKDMYAEVAGDPLIAALIQRGGVVTLVEATESVVI